MRTNARFTDWISGADVTITLRPGQRLAWHTGRRAHEEGWSSEARVYSFDGSTVRCETITDGRDCDGRLTQTNVVECPLADLRARNDEYVTAAPAWERVYSGQRDEYAELAGY